MDPTTIKRCQAGKPDAFAALFEAYKNLVYRTAYLLLDNHHEAEDILQDVFIAVYRSINSYDAQKGAFSTWLHRITVNRCLNQRRGKNHPAVSIDQLPESFLREPAFSEEQLAETDTLRKALDGLSLKQRTMIILRYYWDMSYAEMAEVLDLPLGTVKSRLNLALQSVHTRCVEYTGEDENTMKEVK